jgi:hypothetical protein
MGCADHRISSVCHTHRSWGYVLHGNVGKCKNVKMQKCKNRGASENWVRLYFFATWGLTPE